jgi:hypothetical protein
MDSDYDLFLVIPDNQEVDLRSASKDLAAAVGIRSVDLIPIKYSSLPTLPDSQIYYDLKYGGHHIWGENALDIMPRYQIGHVNPESGKTLLLNRLICAIEAYTEQYEKRGIMEDECFFLMNQTGKVVSACVEALLIKKNKYHYSYRERQKIFISEFPEMTELKRLIEYATEFKIRPSLKPKCNPVQYWKDSINHFLDVLSEHLVRAELPRYDFWRVLQKGHDQAPVTNHPIERVEIMLLLYRESSVFARRAILSRASQEFMKIANVPIQWKRWEPLRERTARLWHELYH